MKLVVGCIFNSIGNGDNSSPSKCMYTRREFHHITIVEWTVTPPSGSVQTRVCAVTIEVLNPQTMCGKFPYLWFRIISHPHVQIFIKNCEGHC